MHIPRYLPYIILYGYIDDVMHLNEEKITTTRRKILLRFQHTKIIDVYVEKSMKV